MQRVKFIKPKMTKYLLAGLVILLSIAAGQGEIEEPAARPVKKGPCDDSRECIRHTFADDDKALCWGYYGCKGAKFETSSDAICSGASACKRGIFDGSQPSVKCNGIRSCYRARGSPLTAGLCAVDKVACNGFQTCTNVVVGIFAPQIYCDGDLACSNSKSPIASSAQKLYATTNSEDNMVYCNGHGACKECIMESDSEVYCDGDAACKDTKITSPTLYCHGKRSCYGALLNNVENIDAFGWFSNLNTTITGASYIRAYGFNSLAMADITTGKDETLVLEAYGFRALAGATITVSATSTLNLICKGNACKGAPIYVSKKADFTVDPPECHPDDAGFQEAKPSDVEWGAKVEGVHCPWILIGMTDEEMNKAKDQFVIDREDGEEMEEILDLMEVEESRFDDYIETRLEDYAESDQDEDDDDYEDDEFFVSGSIMGVKSQQYSSGLLLSNLLTALAVFMMTSGLIYCVVSYKQQQFNYKAIPQ